MQSSHFQLEEPIHPPSQNRAAASASSSSSDDSKDRNRDVQRPAHVARARDKCKNDSSSSLRTTFRRRALNFPSEKENRFSDRKSNAPSIRDFRLSHRPKTSPCCENSASCSSLCCFEASLRPSAESVFR